MKQMLSFTMLKYCAQYTVRTAEYGSENVLNHAGLLAVIQEIASK